MWKDIEAMISATERAITPIVEKVMSDAQKDFN
jgi:hypothetical protein